MTALSRGRVQVNISKEIPGVDLVYPSRPFQAFQTHKTTSNLLDEHSTTLSSGLINSVKSDVIVKSETKRPVLRRPHGNDKPRTKALRLSHQNTNEHRVEISLNEVMRTNNLILRHRCFVTTTISSTY
jgi:hypothetical protein